MIKGVLTAFALCLVGANLSGCVLVAAAGAGYLVADEVSEKDGKVDPLEKVLDYENEAN